MKFESKYGIGEVILTKQQIRGDKMHGEILAKIVGIVFDVDKKPIYACRIAQTGYVIHLNESEIIGDPDFDQEKGYTEDTEK